MHAALVAIKRTSHGDTQRHNVFLSSKCTETLRILYFDALFPKLQTNFRNYEMMRELKWKI